MFETLIDNTVKETIERELPKLLSDRIKFVVEKVLTPELIESRFQEIFDKEPNAPLTELGFNAALYMCLRKYWPNYPKRQAVDELMNYIGEPFGSEKCLWTYASAYDVAREYVADFGESP